MPAASATFCSAMSDACGVGSTLSCSPRYAASTSSEISASLCGSRAALAPACSDRRGARIAPRTCRRPGRTSSAQEARRGRSNFASSSSAIRRRVFGDACPTRCNRTNFDTSALRQSRRRRTACARSFTPYWRSRSLENSSANSRRSCLPAPRERAWAMIAEIIKAESGSIGLRGSSPFSFSWAPARRVSRSADAGCGFPRGFD